MSNRTRPKRHPRSAIPPERLRKARLETIGDVARVLEHESRNLLGSLTTCTQILRRNPHLTGADTELLDIIDGGSNRLREIVSEFATCSRTTPPRLAQVHLHELIEEGVLSLRRDERFSPAIVIQRYFDPTIEEIKADRERLRLAIWHLLLNAAQAMRNEGRLDIETRRVRGEIRITVRDSGPGIPPRARRNIFEPFYTTKPRGLGLGLVIARLIAKEHKGEIVVDDVKEQGARFTLRLPVN